MVAGNEAQPLRALSRGGHVYCDSDGRRRVWEGVTGGRSMRTLSPMKDVWRVEFIHF
jgi:hypothetical protein